MNLLQLSGLVHDKQSSITFLQQRGILHNQRLCRNGHVLHLQLTDARDPWRCRQRQCREDILGRKGIWLQGSRLEFCKVVMFIYCWSKQLTSIKFCDNELDIGKTCDSTLTHQPNPMKHTVIATFFPFFLATQ